MYVPYIVYRIIFLDSFFEKTRNPFNLLIQFPREIISIQLAPGEFKHSWGTAEKLYKSEVP